MTKRNVLLVSFLGLIFFISAFLISVNGLCSNIYFCDRPHDDSLAAIFFPFFPLFLFSLITYKMREEVFQSWFRFARIYIPASIALILLAPSYSSNWMFPYDKGRAAFLFSSLFIIISIVKIILARRPLK